VRFTDSDPIVRIDPTDESVAILNRPLWRTFAMDNLGETDIICYQIFPATGDLKRAMANLLVRYAPEQIRFWIEQERNEYNMTQKSLSFCS